MIETIRKDWLKHFIAELKSSSEVYIISPFINFTIAEHLSQNISHLPTVKVLTRFNLNDFRSKASSLQALKKLEEIGISIKGIKNLHSKVYIFDQSKVIIGSANFTSGGFFHNYEYGIKTSDHNTIKNSKEYFDELWNLNPEILQLSDIANWEKILSKNPAPKEKYQLPDYGTNASILGTRKKRIFIKFFGSADFRESLDYPVQTEIKRSHCHWAVTFSGKRGIPRRYKDGDIVYMAMMLNNKDYAIFGKGVALKHIDKRDKASSQDIQEVSWKEDFKVYIRVKNTEFIDTTMEYCPKLNDLIKELKFDSFKNTQRRFNNGERNMNIKDSLRRQADIELNDISAEWLENKFQEAILRHNKVPQSTLDILYQGAPNLNDILASL